MAAGIAVIGIGLASWQLLPFLEMVEHSHRSLFAGTAGGAFAESYRAAPYEVALALARELFAWIDAPALRYGPAYVNLPNLSVLTVALAVFALVRRPRAWPEAAFALFFLLGMLGSAGGVVPLLTLVFPLAEQLRAPLRMIVPAAFFLSWLGAQGLDRWMAGGGPRPAGVAGRRMAAGALAVAWVAGVGFALSQPRPVWMEPEAFRVPEVVRHAEPRIAADFRSSPRMPLFALDAGVAAGVPTLFLREPLIARSFFEAYFASQFGSLERRGLLARMGNVITLPFQKPSMPILRSFRLSSLIRYDDGHYRAVQLPGVVPRFRIVREALLAAEPRQRWALAASDRWEPAQVAIVEEAVDLPVGPDRDLAPSRLRVLLDEPDHHLLEVESAGALVVTSGLFFPGWGVRVDDREARPLRVDLALRGVVVPPGVHRVEWRYRPTWIGAGYGRDGARRRHGAGDTLRPGSARTPPVARLRTPRRGTRSVAPRSDPAKLRSPRLGGRRGARLLRRTARHGRHRDPHHLALLLGPGPGGTPNRRPLRAVFLPSPHPGVIEWTLARAGAEAPDRPGSAHPDGATR